MGLNGRRYVEANLTRQVAVDRSSGRCCRCCATEVSADVAESSCANAIFQQPWWLDAVVPGRWGEARVERDGRIVARLPFVVRGRGRLRVLTQPPLTQTLGPCVDDHRRSTRGRSRTRRSS